MGEGLVFGVQGKVPLAEKTCLQPQASAALKLYEAV